MNPVIISASQIVKKFNGLTAAVDGVSFSIEKGKCFGFLGPNGAGKTTLMRMIYCFSPRSSGTMTVFGRDPLREPRSIKQRIGVAPQEDSLDPDLTVIQNLEMYARYFDIPKTVVQQRAERLLDFFQLKEKVRSKIDKLSGGMKRRLIIARALINEPELLVLDEPTTGLDPQARHAIWAKLEELKSQGVTLVLTTHYMEEAARLCDELVIMDLGKIIEKGSPAELVERHQVKNLEEVFLKLTGKDLRE
ncbi:MAG: ABC transporter ATP-binding protein [Deltaproteobacteria bacterium]|nr:ABC transporter ATP-binding protein [Deltaproteobacteria bacterium]